MSSEDKKGPKQEYDSEFYKLSQEASQYKKKQFNTVKHMPELNREPDYVVKTRPPMWDDWRLNIVRGIKENKIRGEAGKIASRK